MDEVGSGLGLAVDIGHKGVVLRLAGVPPPGWVYLTLPKSVICEKGSSQKCHSKWVAGKNV